jgi:hypothetical protein
MYLTRIGVVSDCCLTPREESSSYIMVTFLRDDDAVCFVLDQHTLLNLYSASFLTLYSDTLS